MWAVRHHLLRARGKQKVDLEVSGDRQDQSDCGWKDTDGLLALGVRYCGICLSGLSSALLATTRVAEVFQMGMGLFRQFLFKK